MEKPNKKPSEQSSKVQKSILDRLSRIEGQIRGIKKMIEKGTYCDDVINQIEASRSALSSLELILLESHFKHCVARDLQQGKKGALEEAMITIKRLTDLEPSSQTEEPVLDGLSEAEEAIKKIKKMIEVGTYCDDVIGQIEACRTLLRNIELVLLEGHLKRCVAGQLRDGKEEVIQEVLKTIKKLIH
ncbi:metal-sensing transcriptional repressor [Natronincola ferrireducens]|uniref:DNA-binding transcriptional regulator, FrmR family n=1 Tax=Natronincola ferrireducens TaxID=393762 RepID=A0A1G8WQ69_9FIRM|nr:metal-sensing transcriptional repressor [Natronincola ferrireducens]SDJ80236.1 DNA-binding transcriptional regulator, FrmR family [Natronincola ferrireducens]